LRPCARKSDSRGGVPACRKRERHKRAHDVARARNGPSSPVQHASRAASAYAGAQQPGVGVAGCIWCVRAPVEAKGGPPTSQQVLRPRRCTQLLHNCACLVPAGQCTVLLTRSSERRASVSQALARRSGAAARPDRHARVRRCSARPGEVGHTSAETSTRLGDGGASPASTGDGGDGGWSATGGGGNGGSGGSGGSGPGDRGGGDDDESLSLPEVRLRLFSRWGCVWRHWRAAFWPGWLAGVIVVWEPLRVRSVGAAHWSRCRRVNAATSERGWEVAALVPALTGLGVCCVLCLTGAGAGGVPAEQRRALCRCAGRGQHTMLASATRPSRSHSSPL